MDVSSVFDISAAGMNVERLRLEVSAMNLANAHTSRGPDGAVFRPLQVSVRSGATASTGFDATLSSLLPEATVQVKSSVPRMIHDPGHPDADARGFVSYPDVNPVSEMVQLIAVTRSYEANIRALNAAKAMARSALDIGNQRS